MMRYLLYLGTISTALLTSTQALAGETPLYEPAPNWVIKAPAPDANALTPDSPNIVIFDQQQRIEGDRLWAYVDNARRISSPEMLSQAATITVPWVPEKGDFIVHELAITRGTKNIDLIVQGQRFTVLRREQSLEQRELTGILTATLPVEGLQVGDVLRLRASTTVKDMALAGNVQNVTVLPALPVRLGFSRLRVSWPSNTAPKWKIKADGIDAKPVKKGDFTELSLPMPIAKPAEVPEDAPRRYQQPPFLEISTFADWQDVSKIMAPLYQTKNSISSGSELAKEVALIMQKETLPLKRAQAALELVQDKIRYLAIGMNGGNYIPQTPAKTWELRYGDCKAKTLLLLAMLHEMKIDAEPVLANIGDGDLVAERLPSV
jgi:Domain of Unknown Function with PDB structure (DUF3857)